jgi:hypothetical protein
MKKITKEQLKEALAAHADFLAGESGGEKLSLVGCDLRSSDLRWSDLRWSNLRGSDLRYSDLRGSDFSDSDLRGSNFSGSDFSGSDFRGSNLRNSDFSGSDLRWSDFRGAKGMLLLPVQDMRGYSFCHAIETDSGWRIRAGCRDFSIDEAKAHLGSEDYPDRQRGDDYLYAIEWLERKLNP